MESKYKSLLSTNRVVFFSIALLLASIPSVLFADFLWRTGMTAPKFVLLGLFILLITNIAWGTTHAIVGYGARRRKSRSGVIESTLESVDLSEMEYPSVAIVMPVYNEDTERVFAGLRAMFLSLERTELSDNFDFFLLSDSTDSERWIQEESAWATLCRDLGAFGRIHYRRRKKNTDRKAGNLLEFCQDWGQRYRYMITLDADSVMSGWDIVRMTAIMERNPQVGICQTAPKVVGGVSFWGRLQQFANRFYGPVFMAGLNSWQQGDGNYWGHNAIIRMGPFMEFCALPDLPGREPFGGKILSHDFVEAALMRRAGYEVWLASDLEGSYEEGPQDIVEHLVRDRRWCQGNLQHIWLLLSRGLMPASRIHLANGIMGYASSLLWLCFLTLGGIIAYNRARSGLTFFPDIGFANIWELDVATHAALIAIITFSLLFLPKFLGLLDALMTKGRVASFGGFLPMLCSIFLELLVSAMVAPLFMICHSRFVVSTLLGQGVAWKTQNRDAGDGMRFIDAISMHWVHSLIGALGGFAAYGVSTSFVWWLSPVWGGLVLSPVVSWLLSKPSIGRGFGRSRVLSTPEEIYPSRELIETGIENGTDIVEGESGSVALRLKFSSFSKAIVDPYVNAIRATLIEEDGQAGIRGVKTPVIERALREGESSLSREEKHSILNDVGSLLLLYHYVWTRDPARLHSSWKHLMASYSPRSEF